MLSFVVAMGQNRVIGRNQGMPWHLPNDLKWFKEITSGGSRTMLMGRRTFEALPGVLTGRKHVVLTRNAEYMVYHDRVQIVQAFEDLVPYIASLEEFFVIGGGEIFSWLLPYAQKMYLTLIHEDFVGDTFFPVYAPDQWTVLAQKDGMVDENNVYAHTFITLQKKCAEI